MLRSRKQNLKEEIIYMATSVQINTGATPDQQRLQVEDPRADQRKCSFFDIVEKVIVVSLTAFVGMLFVSAAIVAQSLTSLVIGVAFFTIAGVFYFSDGSRVPSTRMRRRVTVRPAPQRRTSIRVQPSRVKKVLRFGTPEMKTRRYH